MSEVPMSDERLAELRVCAKRVSDCNDDDAFDVVIGSAPELLTEVCRLREALQHIANGNISPSITFAQLVLQGASVEEAHDKGLQR